MSPEFRDINLPGRIFNPKALAKELETVRNTVREAKDAYETALTRQELLADLLDTARTEQVGACVCVESCGCLHVCCYCYGKIIA